MDPQCTKHTSIVSNNGLKNKKEIACFNDIKSQKNVLPILGVVHISMEILAEKHSC